VREETPAAEPEAEPEPDPPATGKAVRGASKRKPKAGDNGDGGGAG
jgi:hypothetical protein